jgi:hypothetical protein
MQYLVFKENETKFFNVKYDERAVTCYLACENNVDFVLQVLHEKIPKTSVLQLELIKHHVGVCSHHLEFNLSSLDWVCELTLSENIICTQLPPFLESISCDFQTNLCTTTYPLTLRTFIQMQYVKNTSNLISFLRQNPKIKNLYFSGGVADYPYAFFSDVKQRQIIFDKLSMPFYIVCDPKCFEILVFIAKELYVQNIFRECYLLAHDNPVIETLIIRNCLADDLFLGQGFGWGKNLKSLIIRNRLEKLSNEKIFYLITAFPKLEKIFLEWIVEESLLHEFASNIHMHKCKIIVSICKHDLSCDKVRRVEALRTIFPHAFFESTYNQLSIQHNVKWLPHRHSKFPVQGQLILRTLALSLTCLKKFFRTRNLKGALVHVDPACIEFILEEFSMGDCY